MKQKYNVTGMTCSACSAHVEKSVRKLDGVRDVSVNLLQNSMTVHYDEGALGDEAVIAAVQSGGYGASLAQAKSETKKPQAANPMKEEAEALARDDKRHLGDLIAGTQVQVINKGEDVAR